MKKIISLILALALVLSGSVFSFAEEETETLMDKSISSIAELLRVVNIMDVTDDNFDSEVTRQEFAKIIFKLLTNTEIYPEDYTVSVYPDVVDPEYIGYVNEMVKLKVINGYSDGTFRPESEITLAEAVTFIIRAVGYDLKAEANGGYPSGYLYEAQSTGLLKGISTNSGSYLTFGECAKLIKNTLLAEFKQKDGFSTDGSVSYTGSKYTILKSVYGIEIIKGVVNGIDMTKLFGESTVAPWHILIGEKELDIGELNPREYLGYEVEAYYTIEDDILIHIEETENNITVMDIKDIYSIDNASNIIVQEGYYKNTEYKYGMLTHFIYNLGISNSPFTLDMFEGKNGTLTLIDNDGDKEYEVVRADVYYDIICDYVDISEKLVYDMLTGKAYDVNATLENPYIDVMDATGEIIDIEDISQYDVLSIFETLPEHEQKYAKVIVSKDTLDGSIDESYYNDDGEVVVVIGGEEHMFTDEAMKYYGTSFDASKKHIFQLNFEGYIAAIKDNAQGLMSFGMLIDYIVDETPLETTISVTFMNTSGVEKTVGLNKRVTIDNIEYKNDDMTLLKHLDKSSDIDFGEKAKCRGTQVMKYQLDKDGNIAFIDTVAQSYDYASDTAVAADKFSEADTYNCLRRGPSNSEISSDSTFYWGAQSYDGKVFIGTNTKAFIGPYRNLTDSKLYRDIDSYRIGSFQGYNDHYSSYYDDPESYLASLVLIHRVYSVSSGASGYDITFTVFDKYTYAVNSEGEKGYKLYYWEGSSYKSKFARADAGWRDSANKLGEGSGTMITPDKLKQGDVLRFSTSQNGDIYNYMVCYRAEGDIYISAYDSGNWYSGEKIVTGYLFNRYRDGASYVKTTKTEDISLDSDEWYFNTEVPVLLYNPEEREGQRVTVDHLNSGQYFLTDGDKASRVYVNTKSGKAYGAYIIKR